MAFIDLGGKTPEVAGSCSGAFCEATGLPVSADLGPANNASKDRGFQRHQEQQHQEGAPRTRHDPDHGGSWVVAAARATGDGLSMPVHLMPRTS